jgi:sodium/potassium-transporting ATPase subunit alpha
MKFSLPKLRNIFKKKEVKSLVKTSGYERDFHKITFDELCDKLSTSITDGLDAASAQQKLIKNGKNKITQKRKNPIFKILGYFFSGFCGLIWVAAIVCILAWKPIGNSPDPTNLGLGIMLILVIFIQAAFTAFQGNDFKLIFKEKN